MESPIERKLIEALKKSLRPRLRKRMALQEAMKLNGIEDWTLTPSQEKFLVESTEGLLEKYDKEWFQKGQKRLQDELKIVFKEL